MLSTLTAVVCLGFIAWAIAGADYSYSPSGSGSGESSGIGYMLIAIAGIPVAILGIIGTGLFFLGKALIWTLGVLSEFLPDLTMMIGLASKKLLALLMRAMRACMHLLSFAVDVIASSLRAALRLLSAPAKIIAAIVVLMKVIRSFIGRVLSAIIGLAKAAFRSFILLLSSLGSFVKSVARAVLNIASIIGAAMKNLLKFVGDIVAWVFAMITAAFSRLVKPLMRFALFRILFGAIKNVSAMLLRSAKAALGFMKDVAAWVLAMAVKFVSTILKTLGRLRPFRSIFAGVAGALALLLSGLKRGVAFIGDVLSLLSSALKNIVTSVFGSLPIGKTIRALAKAPFRLARFVRDAFSVGFAGILNAFRSARDVFASSGSIAKAAAGFFGDIGSMIGSAFAHAKKALGSVGSIAIETVRNVGRLLREVLSISGKAIAGVIHYASNALHFVGAAFNRAAASLKSIPVIGRMFARAFALLGAGMIGALSLVKAAGESLFDFAVKALNIVVEFGRSLTTSAVGIISTLMRILRRSGNFGSDVADMLAAFVTFIAKGAHGILSLFAIASIFSIIGMLFSGDSDQEEHLSDEERFDEGVPVFAFAASTESSEDERRFEQPIASIKRIAVIPASRNAGTMTSFESSTGFDDEIDTLSRRLRSLKRGPLAVNRFSFLEAEDASTNTKVVTAMERLRGSQNIAADRGGNLRSIGWSVRGELRRRAQL